LAHISRLEPALRETIVGFWKKRQSAWDPD
jgi:hypothetical protein